MEQSGNRKRLTKCQLRVAFHEAGHVVAAHTEGMPIRKATIIPERDESGHVLHVGPLRGVKLDSNGSDRARLRAESAIIIFLAGRAAQKKYSPRSWRNFHGCSDFANAARLAPRVNGTDAATNAHSRWLDIRAKDLVEAHWDDVVIIAEALVEERTLDRKRIDEIFKSAVATNSDYLAQTVG
jgi:ATP-dependent Zn protease